MRAKSSSSPAAPKVSDRRCATAFTARGRKKVVVARKYRHRQRRDGPRPRVGGVRTYLYDVTKEARHQAIIIDDTEAKHGPIDLFCSNAGAATGFNMKTENAAGDPDDVWTFGWKLHVMAHVYAARALVQRMLTPLAAAAISLQTISAAGLLSQVGSAVYSTTKHAAVGFAENLAITHRDHNIRVSMLCPQGASTRRCCAGLRPGRSRPMAS